MDGQKYAVAEYENQANPAKKRKNLKTYIRPIFAPKGRWPLRGRPRFGSSTREMQVFRSFDFAGFC